MYARWQSQLHRAAFGKLPDTARGAILATPSLFVLSADFPAASLCPPHRDYIYPMSQTKTIICIKWGEKFGPEYVNKLYGMARRNITGDFRLVCFTDRPDGLLPEVETRALPELGCEHPDHTIGKWRKVALWGAELGGLSGPALFVDLDSVIVGNIDDYFSYGSPDDVILARNWAKPLSGLGQTSVFRFPVGKYPHILENFRRSPQAIADKHHFEQHYITSSVPGGIKFWPEQWTRHFRLHCLPFFPLRYFVQAKLPKTAKIVTFPGGPNPDDIVLGRWADDMPVFTDWRTHLRNAFALKTSPRERWRYIKRVVLPCPWIAQHWRV